jgi:transposase, IS5 family
MMDDLFAQKQRGEKLTKLGDSLIGLSALVDFQALAALIDAKTREQVEAKAQAKQLETASQSGVSESNSAPKTKSRSGGRPPYATELMVRIVILQQFFGLSDDQVEFQINDRTSFQRFLGLERSSQIPDSKTLWLFRERIKTLGLATDLFAEAKRQIGAKGYIARGGQVIDATLIRAPVQQFTTEEAAQIKRGEVPKDWSKAKRAQKDLEATWTKKHGKSYFGYKVSVSVDVSNKLIQTDVVSTASEHDSRHFEAALDETNTSRLVLADKGYENGEREARLTQAGWRLDIQRKAKKGRPISACQKRRNTRISTTRARGEHVFATLKQMSGGVIRTIGLARAKVQLTLGAMAYNFKRAMYLVRRDTALQGSCA